MRVRWTPPAARDLRNIVQRIREDNSSAALDVAAAIYDGCGSLRKFPRRGRLGRIEGTRELVFSGLPYIVVYRIEAQIVEVVRIYHGAQDWP
jgi:toxin ParE1/3/4